MGFVKNQGITIVHVNIPKIVRMDIAVVDQKWILWEWDPAEHLMNVFVGESFVTLASNVVLLGIMSPLNAFPKMLNVPARIIMIVKMVYFVVKDLAKNLRTVRLVDFLQSYAKKALNVVMEIVNSLEIWIASVKEIKTVSLDLYAVEKLHLFAQSQRIAFAKRTWIVPKDKFVVKDNVRNQGHWNAHVK